MGDASAPAEDGRQRNCDSDGHRLVNADAVEDSDGDGDVDGCSNGVIVRHADGSAHAIFVTVADADRGTDSDVVAIHVATSNGLGVVNGDGDTLAVRNSWLHGLQLIHALAVVQPHTLEDGVEHAHANADADGHAVVDAHANWHAHDDAHALAVQVGHQDAHRDSFAVAVAFNVTQSEVLGACFGGNGDAHVS